METQILDIRSFIKRRWYLIVSFVLVTVAVTAVMLFFVQKPQYTATATLLIQSQTQTDNNSFELMENQQLTATYEEIIKSLTIANDVITRLHLSMTPNELLQHVQTRSSDQSLVTSILATDENPDLAIAIANGFAESFHENLPSILKAGDVAVLDPANQQGLSSDTKPGFDLMISFLLGLFAAIGLALLFERFDKTVHSESEVQEVLGVPLLGEIPMHGNLRSEKRQRAPMLNDKGR